MSDQPRYRLDPQAVQVRNLRYLAEDRRVPYCWRQWFEARADADLDDDTLAAISRLRADIAKGVTSPSSLWE